MEKEVVAKLHERFEEMVHIHESEGTEAWLARDLQSLLGYSQWRNFMSVIEKAMVSCENAGHSPSDHFAQVRKKVKIGSGATREIVDIALTRYACYLIAQNGDPAKNAIAFAQTYFAVQTRKQEVIEQRLSEAERIDARERLKTSEKQLSGIIFEKLGPGQSFARIRSKGDMALFGGNTTQEMKDRLKIPKGRPLADFLPTITIKAKDFANEITNFNIKRDDIITESKISDTHVKNNEDVRGLLLDRKIVPEDLPPAEDIKKVGRKIMSERKKLPEVVKKISS